MTRRKAAQSVATQPIPSVVVKHFRAVVGPVARCYDCEWEQVEASLAECRIHVRHHPTHHVARTTVDTVSVWAETRDGVAWCEVPHV